MAMRYRVHVQAAIVVTVCLLGIAVLRFRSNRFSLSALVQSQSLKTLPARQQQPGGGGQSGTSPTQNISLPAAELHQHEGQGLPLHADQLVWTSLQNALDQDTTFFSAHYESRRSAPYTPAIIVMGYHMKSLKDPKLYCKFTYSSKISKCMTEPLEQINLCTGGLDADKVATSHMYVCRLKCSSSAECSDDEVPVSVALSRNTDCTGASGQIPVVNRQLPRESEKKMFGVCVQSPTYGSTSLHQIVDFIEMNRALGVEIVTLYVMEMEEETWQFLQDHYVKQGQLQLLRWKKVKKWVPLHYFGQPLLMQDCLYRNMHRVKYLVLIDLDELLLPKRYKNLLELVNSIKGHDNYHSFVLGSCLYTKNEAEEKPTVPCDKVIVPQYFEKTNRISCYCSDQYSYRQKFMIRTEFVLDLFVHWVCWSMKGKEYHVQHSVGVIAHYRNTLPGDCTDKSTTHDTTALQYQSTVMQAIQEHVCPLQHQ